MFRKLLGIFGLATSENPASQSTSSASITTGAHPVGEGPAPLPPVPRPDLPEDLSDQNKAIDRRHPYWPQETNEMVAEQQKRLQEMHSLIENFANETLVKALALDSELRKDDFKLGAALDEPFHVFKSPQRRLHDLLELTMDRVTQQCDLLAPIVNQSVHTPTDRLNAFRICMVIANYLDNLVLLSLKVISESKDNQEFRGTFLEDLAAIARLFLYANPKLSFFCNMLNLIHSPSHATQDLHLANEINNPLNETTDTIQDVIAHLKKYEVKVEDLGQSLLGSMVVVPKLAQVNSLTHSHATLSDHLQPMTPTSITTPSSDTVIVTDSPPASANNNVIVLNPPSSPRRPGVGSSSSAILTTLQQVTPTSTTTARQEESAIPATAPSTVASSSHDIAKAGKRVMRSSESEWQERRRREVNALKELFEDRRNSLPRKRSSRR